MPSSGLQVPAYVAHAPGTNRPGQHRVVYTERTRGRGGGPFGCGVINGGFMGRPQELDDCGWLKVENPLKLDDLGGIAIFWETSQYLGGRLRQPEH